MAPANLIFGGGIPTAPDVQKLMDQYLTDVGDLIPYDGIGECIGLNRRKDWSRYQTIVTAWRKRLFRERNVVLEAVANEGYRVLDSKQRVNWTGKQIKHGFKRIRIGAEVARQTPRKGLTDDEKRSLDYHSKIDAVVRLATATEAKKLTPPDLEKGAD